jgi:hypothetical protein
MTDEIGDQVWKMMQARRRSFVKELHKKRPGGRKISERDQKL